LYRYVKGEKDGLEGILNVYAGAKSVVTVRGVRFKNGRNVQNGAGRRALTPPDPQLAIAERRLMPSWFQ
jgi:hypothetical protein